MHGLVRAVKNGHAITTADVIAIRRQAKNGEKQKVLLQT
jgi:hypothetical protein